MRHVDLSQAGLRLSKSRTSLALTTRVWRELARQRCGGIFPFMLRR